MERVIFQYVVREKKPDIAADIANGQIKSIFIT